MKFLFQSFQNCLFEDCVEHEGELLSYLFVESIIYGSSKHH